METIWKMYYQGSDHIFSTYCMYRTPTYLMRLKNSFPCYFLLPLILLEMIIKKKWNETLTKIKISQRRNCEKDLGFLPWQRLPRFAQLVGSIEEDGIRYEPLKEEIK